MSNVITRKEFLSGSTKAVAAATLGAGAMNLLTRSNGMAGIGAATWPYPYQTLDVEKVRVYAHDAYYVKGCCYGAFHGLVQAIREVVGEPYTSFPTEIMTYGSGGAAGWGTLCGALNGASALISLVCTQARTSVLSNELLGWYTQIKFPSDASNQAAVEHKFTNTTYDQVLPQNISGSVLCHTSNTEWCKASHFAVGSTERKERCARLTGDVAAYAAQILNDEFQAKFSALYVPPTTIAECTGCHSTAVVNNVSAKMECTQCHGNPHATSAVSTLDSEPATYKLEQNYPNPFNPSTRLTFSLPKRELVDLAIYDVHGRLVRTLVDYREHSAGTYAVDWDGTNNDGKNVASGVYFSRMQAGTYSTTKKLSLVK
jgi:hypothetical protein